MSLISELRTVTLVYSISNIIRFLHNQMFCDLTSVKKIFSSHVVNYQLSREYLQFQLRSSRINKFGE